MKDYLSEIKLVSDPDTAFESTTTNWFRGQGDASWHLLPSLYRGGIDPLRERELVRDFRLRSSAFMKSRPQNKLEWRFIMQHYGLPTRLLDWTESHFIALYFAVFNFDRKTDGAVWVLDAWSLNEQTINLKSIPVITNDIVSKYAFREGHTPVVEAEFPVAVRPRRTTERIIAQKGHFTIHGNLKIGIDQLGNRLPSSPKLTKILISGAAKKKILKELFMAGITHSILFPDLDSLAKEIYLRYSDAFMH